jgi:hypothetical protein
VRFLALAVAIAIFSPAQAAPDVTLTGLVSDRACGMDHHGREAQECVRSCAAESGEYALVVGTRVYTLVADEDVKAELYDLAGEQATVTGGRDRGDVVMVKSVKPASGKPQKP